MLWNLLRLVLNDSQRWNKDSIARVVASGELQNVTLKAKIPVLLTYWTAWVDPQGSINLRRDIYGQDADWARGFERFVQDSGAAVVFRPIRKIAAARQSARGRSET